MRYLIITYTVLLRAVIVYSDCGNGTDVTTSDIFISKAIGSIDYAQEGKFKYIDCCAHNFTQMIWEFQRKRSSKWETYPWFSIESPDQTLWLENRNQTLSMPLVTRDVAGVYRCIALDDKDQVLGKHDLKLIVYSCEDRIIPEAYGPKTQHGTLGGAAIFTCTGDFGCTPDYARDISWFDENWEPLYDKELFPRYNVTTLSRNKDTIVESTLEISEIAEEDFTRTFRCFVTSSHSEGNKLFNVHLKNASKTLTLLKLSYTGFASSEINNLHIFEKRGGDQGLNISIITPVSTAKITMIFVVCACLLILLLVIATLFFNRIKLFIVSRLPFGHLKDKGENKYHAFILHDADNEDSIIARQLKKQLDADSYIVRTSENVLSGRDEMESMLGYAYSSKSLIIIHPEEIDVEQNENSKFERLCGIKENFDRNMITVIIRKNTQPTLKALIDKSLVNMEYPSTGYCFKFQEKNFYWRLRLRLPRPGTKTEVENQLEKDKDEETEHFLMTA